MVCPAPWLVRVAALLAGLLLSASSAVGKTWFVEPWVSLYGFYDDNVRLLANNPEASAGAVAHADVQWIRRNEQATLGLGAGLESRQYTNLSDYDRTDGHLFLDSSLQLERTQLGLDARYDYDSTETSEVETSGLVQANKRRKQWQIEPSLGYQLTPQWSLNANLNHSDVAYEDVERIPLYNYRFLTANLGSSYRWTPRIDLFGRLTYDRFDAEQIGSQTHSQGFLLGAGYALSERVNLSASAGLRQSETERETHFTPLKTNSSGPLMQLNLTQDLQAGQLSFSASRNLAPSSTGDVLDTTSLALHVHYPLNDRWRLRLDASGYRNRDPENNSSASDRDYLALTPRIERKLSESMHLDFGYRYRTQRREALSTEASANALFLNVRYDWAREKYR